QDFHEIAGLVAIVELFAQDLVPGIAASAGRAGEGKDKGLADQPRGGARLHRGRADLVVGDAMEHDREAIHALVEQGFERFGGDIAAGKAGPAGGDNGIDGRIGAPGGDHIADLLDIVPDDLPVDEFVARGCDALGQEAARLIFFEGAGVGDGQDSKADGNEVAFRRTHGTASSDAKVEVATTNHAGWRLAMAFAARSASSSDWKIPKQVAPEPDMRARMALWSESSARAWWIEGAMLAAGASRSLRVCLSQATTSAMVSNPGNGGRGGLSFRS